MMHNVLKHMQNTIFLIFYIFSFNKICILSFKNFSTKILVLLRFRSNSDLHSFQQILREQKIQLVTFFPFNLLKHILIETREKSEQKYCLTKKLEEKKCFRGATPPLSPPVLRGFTPHTPCRGCAPGPRMFLD